MQIEELLNDGLQREYKVVITAADLDTKLNTILEDYRTNVDIKGFRKGKAPLSLLKRQHGDRAMGQVLNETMQESTTKLMEEKNIRPAVRPEVGNMNFEEGKDLDFKVKLEVLPEIDVDSFKAPPLERWTAKVEEGDIDALIENIASEQKSFEKAAKTAKAAEGQAVFIDYEGRVDGELFDGGAAEDFQLELGSSMFIPGFEEQLVGCKAGDEKTVTVTFPAEYHSKDLAGKEAEFAVKVKEVRKLTDTKIDDEFAKNLGLDDLAALREAVKGQLEGDNSGLTRARLKRSLLDVLAAEYSFDVPKSMVDLEFRQIWETIKQDMIQSGEATAEDLEGSEGPSDESEAEEFRDIAVRRVRLGLLLSEIGVKNEVQVSQEEVNRRVIEEARRFPGQEAQVFQYFQENEEAKAQLRAPIFEEKVVDFVLEMSDMTDKIVTREELEAAVRAIDEEDANPTKAKDKKTTKKKASPKKKAAPKEDTDKKAAPKKTAAAKKPAKKEAE